MAEPSSISFPGRRSASRLGRGSILLVVLISLMVAAVALTLFIEKASDDLMVEARELDSRRLRAEAYSALETTLCVLSEFKQVNGSLRSPAEGWATPLEFAAYEAASGRTVVVEFIDESGKLSLPKQTPSGLVELFKSWQFSQTDSERLADALLDWCNSKHVSSSGYSNSYEDDPIPFGSPGRSLRSWSELAAIDIVRDLFFDENGQPNEHWHNFTETVSLLDFSDTNINSARPGVLTALGMDTAQQERLGDYLQGRGSYQNAGAGFFKSTGEAASLAGMQGGLGGLGVEIRALRINITVHEGRSQFRLSTIISTSASSAKVVTKKAEPENREKNPTTSASANSVSHASSITGSAGTQQAGSNKSLNYPFTVLEIRENDAMPQPVSRPESPSDKP